MQLRINGESAEIDDDYADGPLLWALRDGLGLIGTKYGCGAGICGSCTVHINGVPTRSCILPAASVGDAEVTTIEGLAPDAEKLHPVQQAFIEQQVPQCAWCMSGQMLTAAALLNTNNNPSDADIVAAMRNNYCRCGCYARIKSAISRAAELTREQSA